MNFEVLDNLFQAIVLSLSFVTAAVLALRMKERRLLILSFAYICFAMGTIYWLLHVVIMGTAPQVFFVAEVSWGASYLFYLSLQILRSEKMKVQFSIPATLAAILVAWQVVWYHILGPSQFISDLCALIMGATVYLAVLRLIKRMPGWRTDIQFLKIIVLQIALYISSIRMKNFVHFNLYFAVDMLLTLSFAGLLPLIYREVRDDLH